MLLSILLATISSAPTRKHFSDVILTTLYVNIIAKQGNTYKASKHIAPHVLLMNKILANIPTQT